MKSFLFPARLGRAGLCLLGSALLTGVYAQAQMVVNVPAGGDIVGASYQVLAAGGGTINLAAGTYNITQSIVMGSNMTLNGAGGVGATAQSVIYAPQTPNGIAMVYGYAGSQNIAVSNLVLDGNIPQAAMLYGTGNGNYAYNDTGIYVYSQSATTVGMTLTNVEVRHTLRGILTGLVDNLTISGCYFHDNNPGGFSHNMYLVATSGVEIDHTRSNNALLGDGLHIDFGGTFYTIRKSEFIGNDGLGLLSQEDNNVTVEDTKLDFNANEGIQINAAGLLLTRDETSYNTGYGLEIPSTPDNAGVVNGFYSIQNDPTNHGGDNGPDYIYGASLIDFTEGNPGPNAYAAIQADGVIGVTDTGDWTLNYGGYSYLGAVDFNANHLTNGSITFHVGNAVATGPYPLVIRYSNGTSANQTLNLSVNGGAAVPVTFPATGSYSTWSTVTVTQTLTVGNNNVTLSVPTGAASAPEIDLLTVTAAQPPPPNAPTNVVAVANGPYSVTLTWTPPANSNSNAAQTYNIYKNNTVPIVATKITGTTWTDTRIFYGETTNSYFVTAVNQGGESGASNTVTVTTGIDAPPGLQVSVKPSTPANNLNWLGTSGASLYLVRRATTSGGPYQTIATVTANTPYPSYSDTTLSNGQTYSYVVAAEDSNNNISANSYQVTAVPQTFSIAASSPSIDVSTATAATDSITVNGTNGFSDQVTFSVTGLPTGVTATFSPNSTSSGGSTQLTVTDSTSSPATLSSYPLTVTGTDGGLTSSVALTLNVGLTQTITFNAVPPQAVGNTFTPSATASSGLPVSFTVVPNGNCSTTGTTVTFLNAGACGIVAGQAGNATYGAAATVGQVVQVNSPQSQTITFNAITGQTSGGSLPLTATASSGLPVSFASATPTVCAVSGSSAALLTGGTCTIVASQSGGGVYGPATSVRQSFTVTAALQSQTITFNAIATQHVGTPLNVAGYASASSGLPITWILVQNGNCSISGTTVTFINPGACGIIANQAGNTTYAAAAAVGQVVQVAGPLQSQTITFAPATPVTYGVAPIALTATGGASGNPVTFTYVSGPGSLSGSTLTVTGAGTIVIAANQAGNSSYSAASPVNASIVVNPASQTITFAAIPGQTAGTALTLSATASSGLAVSYASSTPTVCTVSGSSASLLTAGTCTLTASQAGSANYAAATPVPQSFMVAPAGTFNLSLASTTITLQPGNGVADALTVNPLNGFTGAVTLSLSALPAGVSGSFYPSNPTSSSTNLVVYVPAGTAPGSYPLTITGVSGGLTISTPATLLVQGTQTITFAAIASQTAGGSLTLSATASSGLAVSYSSSTPTVCTVSGGAVTLIAAGTCTITAAQAGNTVYTAAPSVTQSFTVVAKVQSQTITFNTIGPQTIGTSLNIAGYATASSGLPVTFTYVNNGNCTISGTTVTFTGTGNCGINANQAGNASYSAAPSVGQIVQVNNPQSQTITFAAIPNQTAGGSLALTATASSGLAVSFASSTPSVCTVSGSTASLLAGGTCTITASQAGGGAYSAAPSVTQSFTVASKVQSQTITFNTIPPQNVGTPLNLSGYATASSGLPVTFTYVNNGNCSISGTTVTFYATSTCGIIANQSGNASYAAAASVGQVVQVNNALQSQTITFKTIATQKVGTPLNLSGYATASSGLPITWTLVQNGNCSISGTTVTFINSGACGIIANQAGNAAYAAAAAVGQVVQVSN